MHREIREEKCGWAIEPLMEDRMWAGRDDFYWQKESVG